MVKLFLPAGNGGFEVKTNKKGEWSAGGISSGAWQVDFVKAGFETRRVTVDVEQLSPKPPMDIVMKKAAPDANQIVAEQMKKAAGLVDREEVRRGPGDLRRPAGEVPAGLPDSSSPIARAYHAEGATDKAAYAKEIEHLKKYIEKDPNNAEIKLLTGAEMIQMGNPEEGKAMLASVDDTVVKDPMIFVNVGINLMNQNKAKDAMPFFEKAIARFPDSADAYYYRGITQHAARDRAFAPTTRRKATSCWRPCKADLDQVPPAGAERPGGAGRAEDPGGPQVGRASRAASMSNGECRMWNAEDVNLPPFCIRLFHSSLTVRALPVTARVS